jgi:hypothetical protein
VTKDRKLAPKAFSALKPPFIYNFIVRKGISTFTTILLVITNMKYLFYLAVVMFLYRVVFRPKVVVEHRHFYDKKKEEEPKLKPKKKADDYTDFEEIK